MIHLGKSQHGRVSFNLSTLVDTRLLIQSNSGGGKSWAIRRLLEQSHGQVQQIVLDLEGEFSTLREKFDYILAGRGGDTAAEPKSAPLLARRLLELGVSAICDLYELKAHERVRFVRLFLESLIAAPKFLWHPVLVIVDEAHHFCPEKGQAESASAVIDLVTRGRKRGLCGILATQRLSKLHKDACAELLNKMVGRASLDIDQKRAADELGLTTRGERIALRNLRPGEFHCFGPGLRVGNTYQDGVIFATVGDVKTRHPKVGDRRIQAPPEPTPKIKRLLAKLADLPAEAEEKAKTEADLRRDITQLRRELTIQKRSRGERVVDTEQVEKWRQRTSVAERAASESQKRITLAQKQLVRLNTGTKSLSEIVEQVIKALENHDDTTAIKRVGTIRQAPLRQPFVPKLRPLANSNGDISRPQQAILDALAAYNSLGLDQVHRNAVAARAGASPRSSAYTNNVSRMSVMGLVTYPQKGHIALTDDGSQRARFPDSPVTQSELQDGWLRIVSRPQAALLRVLLDIYPESISREELAQRANVSNTSSAFTNNVSRLSTLNALIYPGKGYVKASALLFPEGLVR